MKKLLSILTALLIVVSLAACGSETPPTFSGVEDKTINVGDVFKVMEGVSAKDSSGNDITDFIEFTNPVNPKMEGTYVVTYSVTDSKGRTAEVTRTITVVKIDNEGPILSGVGDKELVIGASFNKMDGVAATDTIDGNCTVSAEGDADAFIPGEYKITYKASDSKGNETVVERTINVTLGEFRFSAEEMVEGATINKLQLNTLEYGYGVIKVIVTSDVAQDTEISFPGSIGSGGEMGKAKVSLKAGDNDVYLRYIRKSASETAETERVNGTIGITNGTIKGFILGVPTDITAPVFRFDSSFNKNETIYLPKALQGIDLTEQEIVDYISNISGIKAFDVRDNAYTSIYVKEVDMSKVDTEQIVVFGTKDSVGNEATHDQKVILVSELLAVDTLNPTELELRAGAVQDDKLGADTIIRLQQNIELQPTENGGFDLNNQPESNVYYDNKIQYLFGTDFVFGEYYVVSIQAKSENADFYTTMRIRQALNETPWDEYFAGVGQAVQIVFNSDDYTTYNFVFKYSAPFDSTKNSGPGIEWDVAASRNYGTNASSNTLHVKSFVLYALSGKDKVQSPYTGSSADIQPTLYGIRDLAIVNNKITFTDRFADATGHKATIYLKGEEVKTVSITKGMDISELNLSEGLYTMKVKYYKNDVESPLSNEAAFTVENSTVMNDTISSADLMTKINTTGRVDTQDNGAINMYYTATGFRVKFTGTKLHANFSTVDGSLGKPYIVVLVDGELYPEGGTAIKLDKGNNADYTLCLGLENKEHIVEVLKRSEASNNTIILNSLSTDGTFGAKVADRAHKILMVGASGSTGYGNLSTASQTPDNSDGMRAFPYLVARVLDADITEVNASGWGLIWGWNDQNGNMNIFEAFKRQAILPTNTATSKLFDFSTDDEYDLIILNIGINDYSVHLKNMTDATQQMADAERYRDRATEFYQFLHEKYPSAVILVVQDDFDSMTSPGYANKQAITSECASYVFTCKIPANGAGTPYGSNGHANVQTHVWSANAILDWIKTSSLKDELVEVYDRLVYDAKRDNQ